MRHSSERNIGIRSRWRDLAFYLLIAIILVGTEIIGLMRDWPRPSVRVGGTLLSSVILVFYLVKVLKPQLRMVRFWLLLLLLLSAHVLWTLIAPFILVMLATGVELFLFGMILRPFAHHSTR